LQRPSIAIGSKSGDKASTLPTTTSAVIAHQDQKLADYIDDYYQILYPCVRADEITLLTIELNSIS
jgi:hypothetical protein